MADYLRTGEPVILRLQHMLSRMGYEPGRLDGQIGPRTRGGHTGRRAAPQDVRQTGQPSGVIVADLDRRLARLIGGIDWLQMEDMQKIAPSFPAPHLPLLQAAIIEIAATPTRGRRILSLK